MVNRATKEFQDLDCLLKTQQLEDIHVVIELKALNFFLSHT
jgi:hypothetical protein